MNITKCFTLISVNYFFFLVDPITGNSVGDCPSEPLDQTSKIVALSLKLMLNLTLVISEQAWPQILCNSTIINRIKQWKHYA